MNDNDPLTIPDDWSDQQALAIFDFLDKLRETVWREYREGIEVLLNIPSVDILHAGYAWRPFTASFAGSNSPGRRRNSQ